MVIKSRQIQEAGKAREACFIPEYIYVLTDQYMKYMNLDEMTTMCIHNNLLRECGHWTCRVEYQRLKNLQADRVREQRREYEREYERERERGGQKEGRGRG